jgi:hypothetical protein
MPPLPYGFGPKSRLFRSATEQNRTVITQCAAELGRTLQRRVELADVEVADPIGIGYQFLLLSRSRVAKS